MHTWGIPGLAFVALYAVLLVAPVFAGRFWARRQQRAQRPQTPAQRPTLYELAWAAGGTTRAVETAIAALLHSGRLRMNTSGVVAQTRDDDKPDDPFEAAIWAASDRCSTAEVAERVSECPEVQRLAEAARRHGLVVPSDGRAGDGSWCSPATSGCWRWVSRGSWRASSPAVGLIWSSC